MGPDLATPRLSLWHSPVAVPRQRIVCWQQPNGCIAGCNLRLTQWSPSPTCPVTAMAQVMAQVVLAVQHMWSCVPMCACYCPQLHWSSGRHLVSTYCWAPSWGLYDYDDCVVSRAASKWPPAEAACIECTHSMFSQWGPFYGSSRLGMVLTLTMFATTAGL